MEKHQLQDKLWHLSFRRTYDSEYFIAIERNRKIHLNDITANRHYDRLVLELGPGWGEVAIQMALETPTTMYVLLEKKMKRISHILKGIRKHQISNIRILPADFRFFLGDLFAPELFDEIILNFPDPWPKKKHWKNRTVNQVFLNTLNQLLRQGGWFHFATDYGPYARKVISILEKDHRYSYQNKYSFQRDFIPPSRFELEKKESVPRLYYISRIKL